MKRLPFGTPKCIKLHIGKPCNETMCRDLFEGGWKLEVETDELTGVSAQREFFAGMEKMKMKEEQMYLCDIISADGSHSKNVRHRKNKGLGIINQIMDILTKFTLETITLKLLWCWDQACYYLLFSSTQKHGSILVIMTSEVLNRLMKSCCQGFWKLMLILAMLSSIWNLEFCLCVLKLWKGKYYFYNISWNKRKHQLCIKFSKQPVKIKPKMIL